MSEKHPTDGLLGLPYQWWRGCGRQLLHGLIYVIQNPLRHHLIIGVHVLAFLLNISAKRLPTLGHQLLATMNEGK